MDWLKASIHQRVPLSLLCDDLFQSTLHLVSHDQVTHSNLRERRSDQIRQLAARLRYGCHDIGGRRSSCCVHELLQFTSEHVMTLPGGLRGDLQRDRVERRVIAGRVAPHHRFDVISRRSHENP